MQRDLFLRFVVGLNGAADTADFSGEDAVILGRFGDQTEIRVVSLALAEIGDPSLVVFSELQGRDNESVVGFEVHGSLEHVRSCVARFRKGGDLDLPYTMFGPKYRIRSTRTHQAVGLMPRPEDGTTLGWLSHPEVEVFGIGALEDLMVPAGGDDIEMRFSAL